VSSGDVEQSITAVIVTAMAFGDYKILLNKQDDGWVAEIPARAGCYALMPTREETLTELRQIFQSHRRGVRGERRGVAR